MDVRCAAGLGEVDGSASGHVDGRPRGGDLEGQGDRSYQLGARIVSLFVGVDHVLLAGGELVPFWSASGKPAGGGRRLQAFQGGERRDAWKGRVEMVSCICLHFSMIIVYHFAS